MPSPCIVAFCKKRGSHIFPKDDTRRAQWIEAIEHIKPGLTIRKHSKICSDHFKPSDFVRTPLSVLQPDINQKTLKRTAVPSIFPWKSAIQESTSHADSPAFNTENIQRTYARTPPIQFVTEQSFINAAGIEDDEDPLKLSSEDTEISCNVDIKENIIEDTEIPFQVEYVECDVLPEQLLDKIEKTEQSVQTDENNSSGFSIHHYKNNDKAIYFYTGLENFKKVMLVFSTLGQCAHKLNYFYGLPPNNLDAFEQFFITLLILRRHKPFEEIAMMYQVTIKQIYNIFITWIRFMSLQWRNLDLWVDKESVKAYMPLNLYDKYPSTRVILDATELPIKKPKMPFAQQVTFSTYKNRNTVKVFIGITPSGMISYVSPCYGGSATDRQIIERSSILNRFDYNDEIMVDKGLNVQDIFLSYGVKVNIPSFFKKGSQIGPHTLALNRKGASKRVHVERVMGLLKTYKILCQPMNQTEIVLSSDIVFICAMLVNFRSGIVNKYA